MSNDDLSDTERLSIENLLFYGYFLLTLIGTITTAVERSVKFYLYFMLNSAFRNQFFAAVKRFYCCKFMAN